MIKLKSSSSRFHPNLEPYTSTIPTDSTMDFNELTVLLYKTDNSAERSETTALADPLE